jgi:exopolysaccharide biosynthesis polyprenyl glycosylphosphotransferase
MLTDRVLHCTSLKKSILFIGDILCVVFSYPFVFFLIYGTAGENSLFFSPYIISLIIVVRWSLTRLHSLPTEGYKPFAEMLTALNITIIETVMLVGFAFWLAGLLDNTIRVIISAIFVQMAGLSLWYYLFYQLDALTETQQVLIVGDERMSDKIVACINAQNRVLYRVKYITKYDNNLEKLVPNVDAMILSSKLAMDDKVKILQLGYKWDKQIIIVPEYYDLFYSTVELDRIDDMPVFRTKCLQVSATQRMIKRAVDIAVAGVGLTLLLPIYILTAAAIWIGSPGPVHYSQIRIGENGNPFKIYKFRTMVPDAEKASGPVLAADNDSRITYIGRILRKFRLDEVPQLLNVLKGDMSMVGPRPERPYFVEQFRARIPAYDYRHRVKPGITGFAQIYGRYTTTPEDKLIYDLLYIQRCSITTDFLTMLRTFRVLIDTTSATGARGKGVTEKVMVVPKN